MFSNIAESWPQPHTDILKLNKKKNWVIPTDLNNSVNFIGLGTAVVVSSFTLVDQDAKTKKQSIYRPSDSTALLSIFVHKRP